MTASPHRTTRPRAVSAALLDELLQAVLDQAVGDGASLDVIDLGGGTGHRAAELAQRGHRVVVIDPSPDALASLDRRAADLGLTGLSGVQGDTTTAVSLVGPDAADVVVCHQVLEVVDDPAEALAAIAELVRPGGALSLTVSLRPAAVLAQAVAGHFDSAERLLDDPRRFDLATVTDLVGGAGFELSEVRGVGAVSSLVHEATVAGRTGGWDALLDLERRTSRLPDFVAVAPLLHVAGRRR